MKTKMTPATKLVAAAPLDSIYTARHTLKEWLQALEQVSVLKPGATTRILTSRKLARMALPNNPTK